MHELAIAQRLVGLIDKVSRDNGGAPALVARVEIGDLAGVDAECLRFGFEVSARGTVAERCRLEAVRVPLRLRCRECGEEGAGEAFEPCGKCGKLSWEILTGRELRLESVELDDDPPQAQTQTQTQTRTRTGTG